MADEGFDPCECIWSHEMAMRRLLSLLRQSQSYCTDTECFNELPGPTPSTQEMGSDSMMLLGMLWALLAVVLFFMRPSALRTNPNAKPANSNQDGGAPPAPPTAN
ncbi:small integral membrane protein 14 [Procambarus clarkii]|uniref:small integral membrane protein 14 n=1 Tax=Procambarus clarkii TaxID=6728 RepID=UPI001E67082A|nr:small integral membrane protein 14-like isoform X2 [Procambarus clarkii]